MLNKVYEFVEKHHMLQAGDKIVTGVSGGADSVCLFLVLCKLQERIPFTLKVVHVNHMIREDATHDEEFVRALCEKRGVPFYPVRRDVAALGKEWGISTEEAGRQVRYRAFEEACREGAYVGEAGISGGVKNPGEAGILDDTRSQHGPAVKIAVAHHKDDRAETMLFHLFRGTGMKGLGSIRPVQKREGKPEIIRPLMCLEREEIEAYLKVEGMDWCEDSTNEEDAYTRNRIRHHILPYAREEISKSAVNNMNRTANLLSEAQDFIEKEAKKAYKVCAQSGEEAGFVTNIFNIQKFLQYHTYLQKEMVLLALEELTPARKDITERHVEDILELAQKPGNREICLPYELVVRREYDKLIFSFAKKSDMEEGFYCVTIAPAALDENETEVPLPDGRSLVFTRIHSKKIGNIPQNRYTKWFDCDKINGYLEIRTRKRGDYLMINDAGSTKSLQDYMVNEKIPRQQREKMPLLACGSHILWVMDYRISSYYKIEMNTNHILQVQLRGGQ